MNTQSNDLDKHIADVMVQITRAASKHDLAAIQHLSRKAKELQEIKEHLTAIHQRIASLSGEANAESKPIETNSPANGRIRELPIEVTDGMVRQNLLTLSPHIRSGKIKVGEELIIEALPSGEKFQTTLLDKGNKLRARGEITRFYKDAKVKGGDYVLLTEVSQGRWTLKKAPPGQYGFSRF